MHRTPYVYAPTAATTPLKLAVVIPCHNVEDTLDQQLDALVSQRWKQPWGIVVVDNCSTDGTAALAHRYESKGVRVVAANSGRGVAYARNAGLLAVDAESVAFCDGDDEVSPGWVAAMGDGLELFDLVSGRIETEKLNPPWLTDARPMRTSDGLPTFGKVGFASGCNSGVRRSLFLELSGYDEQFVGLEDIEFSLRAVASGATIAHIPDACVSYRFRQRIGQIWRQGRFYGRGRPALIHQARSMGLPGPGRFDGWRSWVWLVMRLPQTATRSGRARWVWVLGNRVGVLEGSLRMRSLYI